HTYHLAPRPLMVVVCEPIETTGMTTKDAEALTQRLMDSIAAEYYRHSQLVRPEALPENQAKIPSSQL
ncbi:MAG TPA: 1-acyl-sn-glycerol-3-phosphate acyltransferase, partial [Terriglobus sp.]